MKLNHQLREQLYNAGYKMSPEAKRTEVEKGIKDRQDKYHKKYMKELAIMNR